MAEFVLTSGAGDECALHVSGDVDIASVEELLAAAQLCLCSSAPTFDVDLAGVTFIDSSGLGALVRLRKEAETHDKTLRLLNVPTSVSRLFAVTGLEGLFSGQVSAPVGE